MERAKTIEKEIMVRFVAFCSMIIEIFVTLQILSFIG